MAVVVQYVVKPNPGSDLGGVGQLACVDFATGYVDIIARYGEPRHSH
jgi:hypothetical protein